MVDYWEVGGGGGLGKGMLSPLHPKLSLCPPSSLKSMDTEIELILDCFTG